MKRKKIFAIAMTLVLAITVLAGCGSKEQTVTYRSETQQNGFVMVDTMTLNATGDKLEKLTEILEIDMDGVDEATQEVLAQTYDEIIAMCEGLEGVACSGELDGTVYRLNMEVDTTNADSVAKLVELGLLTIEGDSTGLSMKKTKAGLEAGGFELVE